MHMRGNHRLLTGLVGACLMLVSAAICRAQTTITVNSTNDPSDPGNCTLRDAIDVALGVSISPDVCATSGSGAPFTIVFSGSLAGGSIILGSTLPTITGTDLTITGPTTSSAGIAIDGGGSVQLMQVDSDATLNLQYLTLQNGSVVGDVFSSAGAGAIFNSGTLNITNSTLSANQAIGGAASSTAVGPGSGEGGAIFNAGTVTITNSTLSANQATGGASSHFSGGTGSGGAIFNEGTVTITNSTFSANQATGGLGSTSDGAGVGGAIFNYFGGTLTISSSTFSANQATGDNPVGGGIYNFSGTANLKDTILAASAPDNCGGAAPTDEGYNISDDSTCGFAAGAAANGQAIGDGVNPLLDTAGLADNGGPTQTIALQAGSPAIDAIPVASCTDQSDTPIAITTDQRGEPRPDPEDGPTGNCDIGAYEFQQFAGTPGATNCNGHTVSALSNQFGTLDAAASALGYPSVKALHTAIKAYCAG
jgi:hypothetical protein